MDSLVRVASGSQDALKRALVQYGPFGVHMCTPDGYMTSYKRGQDILLISIMVFILRYSISVLNRHNGSNI